MIKVYYIVFLSKQVVNASRSFTSFS